MINQKTAVVNALMDVLASRDVEYVLGGDVIMASVLTKEDKDTVRSYLCNGFHEGEIQMSESARAKYVGNETEMKKYVSGLVNNWIRKNPDFNCGVGYTAKNPGSRTGQSDETIKNLRLMLKSITDEATKAEIDKAIAVRLAEIKPESVVTVNAEAIPEHLRRFIK